MAAQHGVAWPQMVMIAEHKRVDDLNYTSTRKWGEARCS